MGFFPQHISVVKIDPYHAPPPPPCPARISGHVMAGLIVELIVRRESKSSSASHCLKEQKYYTFDAQYWLHERIGASTAK